MEFSPLFLELGANFIARSPMDSISAVLSSTFLFRAVAPQHLARHKSASSKGLSLSHRAVIAAILSPAQAAADLRMLSLGVLLLSVILIPLSRAAWMPAT
ncbi:MAG: hypothetical protein J0I52_07160 [Bordetella sp.]|nr:hypothetical protein [Bordetella sp.]